MSLKSFLLIFVIYSLNLRAQSYKSVVKEAELKYNSKAYGQAAPLYELAFNKTSDEWEKGSSLYNAACSWALAGNTQKAFEDLYKAVDNGWTDTDAIPLDNDLVNLYQLSEWPLLLARVFEKPSANQGRDRGYTLYRSACYWAIAGDKTKAFKNLNLSAEYGGLKIEWLQAEKNLAGLHHEKEWHLLVDKLQITQEQGKTNYFWGIYFGILIFLFVYNMFLYFTLKEISFLYYSLFIFFYANFETIRTSTAGFYLTDIFFWIKYMKPASSKGLIFNLIILIFQLLFVRSFLDLKINAPKMAAWMKRITIFFTGFLVLSYFFNLLHKELLFPVILLTYLFVLGIGIYTWVKGYRPARFFVIGSIASTISVFLVILPVIQSIKFNAGVSVFHIDNIGNIVFFGLLAFALGDKINILKKEKEGAQEKAMEILEEKVEERTLEIVKQKHVVEEKQKEIIESITYAKRLQEAILPPFEFVNKYLPENFILYKPKDIVAGDFYWAEKMDDLFFIAAADSTGHGVPGAMVSVVCSNALNRSLKEFKETETGKILDKTRELVLQTFEKSTSEVKDGMDVSLLCIDNKNKKIFWSGANNPLWYVENNGLKEIKADKQPIGKTDYPKPFTTHQIDYFKNTVFYLFTDGYADQFGGPGGKKFKYKQFSELLVKNHLQSFNEQSNILDKTFNDWKGELEQVDDVCLIGIRI
jgi:serine phosphatase RsbU (regulator of sigma subunit)